MIKTICSFVTSMGQKKNIPSPQRELNPWPPRYQLSTLTTELHETHGELGHFSRLIHVCDMRPANKTMCL